MKIKFLALTTGITICSTIASGVFAPAMAVTFDLGSFGEDINANGGLNFVPNNSSAAWRAEDRFRSKLSGSPNTQNFDSVILPTPSSDPIIRALTPGTPLTIANFPGTSSITTTSTEVAQTLTTTFATKGVRFNDSVSTPTENGRFATSGTNYYEVGNGTFTITFTNPMAALGFYATDVENQEGITLQFDNDPTRTLTIPRTLAAGNTDKSLLYYGFVAANSSEIFTTVRFGISPVSDPDKANDKFGLDDLTFATSAQVRNFGATTAVPEPLTIVGTLLGGTVALRLRKKLKSSNKL
jgi:hypothetical protein